MASYRGKPRAAASSSATSAKALATESGYKPRPKKPKEKPRSASGYKDPLTEGVAKSELTRDLHQKKEGMVTRLRDFLAALGGKK